MTNQTFPITPPTELVELWRSQWVGADTTLASYIAAQAARWGADQELEACCELIADWIPQWVEELKEIRRPNSPSLKEQALEELDELLAAVKQLGVFNPPQNIRRALEQLNG